MKLLSRLSARLKTRNKNVASWSKSAKLSCQFDARCSIFVVEEYERQQRFDKREDREAIRYYTGSGHKVINKALRDDTVDRKPKPKKTKKKSKKIDKSKQGRVDALLRATSKSNDVVKVYRGTVYRGSTLPDKVKDGLRPGATYCDPAFMSASWDETRSFNHETDMTFFKIESKTGVDVSKFSKHQEESEILFRPGTLFMIKSVEEKAKIFHGEATLVTMEELH